MKHLFKIIGVLFLISPAFSQSDSILQAELKVVMKENSYPIQVTKERISGKGADILLREARESQVFMFGENHGIVEIAQLSRLLYQELSEENARILVTEIGPATATETESLIRSKNFEKFLDKGVNLMSVPFFFLEQEVPLLYTAANNFPKGPPSIWGLDQEFIAGAPIVLRRLERLAATEKEKAIVQKAYRKFFFNPFMIGQGDGEILLKLEEVFAASTSPEARRITQQLVQSYEIYQANSDGRGRWSNETRESLMMQNFEWYLSNYPDSIPPLFFRFGAFHVHKGSSPTVKEALGLRIDQWAKKRGWSTINVLVDAAAGKTLNPLLGTETDLPPSWTNSIFKKQLIKNGPTLFDLRKLKGHPETKNMSNRFRHMINGYDYLILLPEGHAQNYLPGTLITYAYGIPILGIVLLTLTGLVYGVIKLIKRWKKRK